MTTPAVREDGRDRWLLQHLASAVGDVPVRLQLHDTTLESDVDVPVATVRLADRWTALQLLLAPAPAFGEAYMDGRLRVTGDLTALLAAVSRAAADRPWSAHSPAVLARWLTGASAEAARVNVNSHYGLGEDFYRLWLDEQLVYSCAYFEDPGATLEAAQVAKLDYICRKLQLQPGERVLEIGSGWGALSLHLAREYGVTVDGYNVSAPQIAYARRRAARENLDSRVTFIDADFRLIHGTYDAVVSVGMLEHVGRRQLAAFGRVLDRALDPVHGRGLLHFIGRTHPRSFNPWILRHIFPGAYSPTLAEVSGTILAPWNLSVVDVENLRLHYAETLRHWRTRFDAASDRVTTMFGEAFTRMWHLYLSEARAGFLSGDLQLFQVVFARHRDNALPWTRASLYDRS